MPAHHLLELLEIDATTIVSVNIANEKLPNFIWHDFRAGTLLTECGLKLLFVNVVIFAGVEGGKGLSQVFFTDGTACAKEL